MNEPPSFPEFLKGLYSIWITERPNQLAAGLAYFGMFSFAPVIVIVAAVAGLFIDADSLLNNVYGRIEETLGPEVTTFIRDLVEAVDQPADAGSVLLSLVAFLALLFAASSFFFQLQYALNRIWKVPPPERGQTRAFLLQRLFSVLIVVALGLLVVALALINIFGTWLDSLFDIELFDLRLGIPAFIVVATTVFALFYKYLPNKEIAWRGAWVGAGSATVLITIGGALVVWLLGLGRIGSGLAAAGAFIVVLLLIYYVAQIFLLGAIISREYASWHQLRRSAG